MTSNKTYRALLNGEEVTARKMGRTWLVGGDKVQPGQAISILLEKDGRPAWFTLNGAVLKFSDFEG